MPTTPAATKKAAKPATKTAATTAVKTTVKAAAKATKVKAPATKTSAAGTEPSLRFHHSKALRDRTNAVLGALEKSPNSGNHGEAIADLVSDLVEAGMDYYFMRALKQADVGFLKEQSARLGITGAVTLINSVCRKFIVRMDAKQLLAVSAHIRSLA